MHMHRIFICGRLALQYLSTLSHKRHSLRKTVIECKMCVLIFSTAVFCNIYHSNKNWARYNHNVYRSSCKLPLLLSHFNETWNFSTDFRRIFKYQYHDNRSCGTPVVPWRWTDGWTDGHDDANSRTLKLCERAWRAVEHGHCTRGSIVTRTADCTAVFVSPAGATDLFLGQSV